MCDLIQGLRNVENKLKGNNIENYIQKNIVDNFITKEIPRYESPNPLNLTKLEQIQRKREVEELSILYPNLPLNLIWDIWEWHFLMDKDELKEKIANGFFEKKST